VESAEQAWQAIHRYSSRWPIEDFHRGVKTGCRLEQRHLQEQGSLANLLAIVSPMAVRLLQLRNLCREEPEQPAMVWVEPEEAQVIASQQGVAVERLTIEQFVFSVAQLGGFLRRACDGPPGWQTLWEGWLRLRWFVAGMRFAAHAPLDNYARSP
jgi:Transposase Tn5 dimerisation domain